VAGPLILAARISQAHDHAAFGHVSTLVRADEMTIPMICPGDKKPPDRDAGPGASESSDGA
jgi:hypothetical protein